MPIDLGRGQIHNGGRCATQGEETVVLENHDLVIAVQVLLLPFRPELGPSPGLFAVSGFAGWQ